MGQACQENNELSPLSLTSTSYPEVVSALISTRERRLTMWRSAKGVMLDESKPYLCFTAMMVLVNKQAVKLKNVHQTPRLVQAKRPNLT